MIIKNSKILIHCVRQKIKVLSSHWYLAKKRVNLFCHFVQILNTFRIALSSYNISAEPVLSAVSSITHHQCFLIASAILVLQIHLIGTTASSDFLKRIWAFLFSYFCTPFNTKHFTLNKDTNLFLKSQRRF